MDASISRQDCNAKTKNFNLQLSVPMEIICVCMLLTETCHILHTHTISATAQAGQPYNILG